MDRLVAGEGLISRKSRSVTIPRSLPLSVTRRCRMPFFFIMYSAALARSSRPTMTTLVCMYRLTSMSSPLASYTPPSCWVLHGLLVRQAANSGAKALHRSRVDAWRNDRIDQDCGIDLQCLRQCPPEFLSRTDPEGTGPQALCESHIVGGRQLI